MSWITHISRNAANGELLCNTQGHDGTRQALPVYLLPRMTSQRRERSRAVQLDSAHHEVADVSEYLRELGWSSLQAHGQTLHKFFTPDGEVWMPSQLLVQSLFAVIAPMAKSIFTPIPLTTFCRPVLDSSENDISFRKGHPLSLQSYLLKKTARQRLSWLAHSKSARRAWGSVYRNALDGLLDCVMPEGIFQFSFDAIQRSNILCVTRATLHSVTCDDIFTRRCSGPQTFTFRKDLEHLLWETAKPWSKTSLPALGRRDIKCLEMTDAQFETIRSLLEERQVIRRHTRHSRDLQNLRSQLNLIHTRSVHGCRWVDLCADAREIETAQVRHIRLQRKNQWGDIQDILRQEDSTEVG